MADKDFLPAKTYRDLVVWQKAHALAIKLFEMNLPQHAVTTKLREYSLQCAADIVVSYRKKNRNEKLSHLQSALEHVEHMRYYAHVASDLGLLSSEPIDAHINEVGFPLNNYHKSITKPRDNEAYP